MKSKARIRSLESALYIVATPIGNLGDITHRAIETLAGVDLVAAEDTRHTKKLLSHLGLTKDMQSLHDHNERDKASYLLDLVAAGGSVALVSDAGTPLISDPGYVLVAQARQRELKVVPVPGACALIAALSASGLACDRFSFEGFLPVKSKAKRDALEILKSEPRTCVYYESTHRIVDTLKVVAELLPKRQITIARELTKTFETFLSGPSEDVLGLVASDANQQKGEFVLIVEGWRQEVTNEIGEEPARLLNALSRELPPKKAAMIVADHYGLNKK
ncbi:rRNA (cytidine-2'-O-)-methyltransferase [Oleiphilus sp. HI0073]|nr:rRNA (cytidine-2'-O-)-methyltransferase [Oleiphilus sp. HI0073]